MRHSPMSGARILFQALSIAVIPAAGQANLQTLAQSVPQGIPTWVVDDWRDQDRAGERGIDIVTTGIVRQLPAEVAQPLQNSVDALGSASASDPRWVDLYERACHARRAVRLYPTLAQTGRLVFVKRGIVSGGIYNWTEAVSNAVGEGGRGEFAEFVGTDTSALCLLEMDGCYATVRDLLAAPGGMVRDPDVSFDARKVLFSWKKSAGGDDYHLYEMELGSVTMRQLTFGDRVADYEGIYLQDDDILFSSTRHIQDLDCWFTPVSNLFRCDGDGRYIRRLGYDQATTNFQCLLPSGEVLYTRWDYNDRTHTFAHPLFIMKPDGTQQRGYYSYNAWWPTTTMHARGIPGTTKAMAVIAGYHVRQSGYALGIVDVAKGDQDTNGMELVAPIRPITDKDRRLCDGCGNAGPQYAFPYPLDEERFLVSFRPRSMDGTWGDKRLNLYFMDLQGNRELLYYHRAGCLQAQPVQSRQRPPQLASPVDYSKSTAECSVIDIYHGPGLAGVPRGTIKKIRVVALEYRAKSIGRSGHDQPQYPTVGVTYACPIGVRNAAWDVKKVLGETPVHDDGSAYFVVPARTPIYLQMLDDKGRAVQTMRSWATLQPGEHQTCYGCHESKQEAPPSPSASTMAFRSGPKLLDPFYDASGQGFSFPRFIQPILDDNCIRCHDGTHEKGIDLRAVRQRDTDARKEWSLSYLNLTKHVNWMKAESPAVLVPPSYAGAARSPLDSLLDSGHQKDPALSREALDKLRCWMDLAVPFSGDYTEGMYDAGDIAKYNDALERRRQWEAEERESLAALAASAGIRSGHPYLASRSPVGPACSMSTGASPEWQVYRLDGRLVGAGTVGPGLRVLAGSAGVSNGVFVLRTKAGPRSVLLKMGQGTAR